MFLAYIVESRIPKNQSNLFPVIADDQVISLSSHSVADVVAKWRVSLLWGESVCEVEMVVPEQFVCPSDRVGSPSSGFQPVLRI